MFVCLCVCILVCFDLRPAWTSDHLSIYGMVWYGMVWYGMVSCGMVSYGMAWYVCMCVYVGMHAYINVHQTERSVTVEPI